MGVLCLSRCHFFSELMCFFPWIGYQVYFFPSSSWKKENVVHSSSKLLTVSCICSLWFYLKKRVSIYNFPFILCFLSLTPLHQSCQLSRWWRLTVSLFAGHELCWPPWASLVGLMTTSRCESVLSSYPYFHFPVFMHLIYYFLRFTLHPSYLTPIQPHN